MNTSKRRYDGKHRVTRILLSDYLLLKDYAVKTGESMAQALHSIITRDWAMAQTRRIRVPVPIAQSPVIPKAKVVAKNVNAQLRATVAGRG